MKLFLRSIKLPRWDTKSNVDWLEDDELKGDALRDVQTQNGRLSVYKVTSEADMERVSVALAATRQDFSSVDYAVFADSDLERFGITVQQTKDKTPDDIVNRLHYELGNLTVKRLVLLSGFRARRGVC